MPILYVPEEVFRKILMWIFLPLYFGLALYRLVNHCILKLSYQLHIQIVLILQTCYCIHFFPAHHDLMFPHKWTYNIIEYYFMSSSSHVFVFWFLLHSYQKTQISAI